MKPATARKWKSLLLAGVLCSGALAATWSTRADDAPKPDNTKPDETMLDATLLKPSSGAAHIDVVFAIDCSGSMGPVIETAKKKVWTIVNQIAKAEPAPVLRIGLIGYGDGDRTFRTFPLSDDLDTVYQNLMTFKDEGWGSEYVGLAVHKATSEMNWSQSATTNLKVIYVLGNETARQGPEQFDYGKTAPVAANKNIIINAIYCNAMLGRSLARATSNQPNSRGRNNANNTNLPSKGATPPASQIQTQPQIAPQLQTAAPPSTPAAASELTAETTTWMEMALLGKGKFLEISSDGGAVNIPTPYDAQMIALNTSLNDTYIPYGRGGAAGKANQMAQDTNSSAVGGAVNMAARVNAKSSGLYNARGWDLVDASREKDFDWSKVEDKDLPENLREKSASEKKRVVEEAATKRSALQLQIRDLNEKRDAFINAEIKKQNLDTGNSFDDAVRRSIVEQAASKGFRFK